MIKNIFCPHYDFVYLHTKLFSMLFNNKDLSKRVLERVKKQRPLQFQNVTANDIEKLLNYYSYVISKIIKSGGYLTLSVYKTHLWNRCIRCAPIQRYVVYKKYGLLLNQKNYRIRQVLRTSYLKNRQSHS